MYHDGKLETCTFRGKTFINKNSARKNLLQKNHKNGSRTKDFNKNTYTSNISHTRATIDRHRPREN